MKTLADMDDLEAAIMEKPVTPPNFEHNPTLILDDDDEIAYDKNP